MTRRLERGLSIKTEQELRLLSTSRAQISSSSGMVSEKCPEEAATLTSERKVSGAPALALKRKSIGLSFALFYNLSGNTHSL